MADDLRQMLVLAASRQDSAFARMEKGEKPELTTDDACYILSCGIAVIGMVAGLHAGSIAETLTWQGAGPKQKRLLELLAEAAKEPDAVPPD